MIAGSLRLRLLVAGAVSILVALGVAAFGLSVLFERHAERGMTDELVVLLDRLAAGIDRDADGKLAVADPPDDPRFEKPLSGLYWQVTREPGGLVDRSRSLWDFELTPPQDEPAEGTVHRHRIAGPGGTQLMAVERRIVLPARLGGATVRLVVGRDAADLATARAEFTSELLPFLALVALLLVIASAVQVRVGLAPLAAVQARLAAIRSGRTERLGIAFPDEVRPLAAEVDGLLVQRDRQVETARARAADLAHGLKTPLQVLAGDIDRLKQKGETAIAADLDLVGETMRRHVERELARARRTAVAADAAAPVGAVAQRVVDVVRRTPTGDALDWEVTVDPQLAARIAPDDLAEILGNLLDNAARHARERVAITAAIEDGDVVLRVIDDGPGIPAALVPQALRRGGRIDSGPGTGLGLAIASDIADAWNGTLRLGPTEPGRMTAAVRLPRAAPLQDGR
ncbi:ATP-binding protein [Rhodoplanes elegans]|uniref:histidine kinase n=1 Tax=Rhodoplanes elegans TaxID=29408 RepID=A0A327K050_9BRAD|nr:HAMP domain-containing sensor histidine kinase [Rhodoplanes elegans]MBK5960739.1 ATP-binding protein [Rhodoplanes elegans]RAI30662.1 ATP-binding protein [Rhodoplanes elegans]